MIVACSSVCPDGLAVYKALPLTARGPFSMPVFESWLGHVEKLPVTWGEGFFCMWDTLVCSATFNWLVCNMAEKCNTNRNSKFFADFGLGGRLPLPTQE